MKKTYTIKNFAKRLVMMLAIGMLAVNAWGTTYTFDLHSNTSGNGGEVTYWYSDAGCNTHVRKYYNTSNPTTHYNRLSSGSPYTMYYKDATITSAKTFVVCSSAADKYAYFHNNGYLIFGQTNSYLTLPTFSGEKITNVTVTTSSTVAGGANINVYSDDNPASTTQTTTSNTSEDLSFDITSTYQNDALKIVVENAKNFQLIQIVITTATACDKSVTVSNGGSSTNGSITSITTSPVATCSSTASDRRVSIVVTPSTGYVAPEALSVGSTTGTVNSSKYSRTDNGNGTFTFVYEYNQNDNGTISYNAACVGKQCTVTFDKNSGTGGDNSVTATYGSGMTSITPPTRTHYTFDGYYDSETDNDGTGNKYYNADGSSAANWNKNTTAATTLYAKWTEHSLTNYRTVCCTELGDIKGTITWPSPTKAHFSWGVIANVKSTSPYTSTDPYEVTCINKSTSASAGSITTPKRNATTTKDTCSISGLTAGTTYTITMHILGASGYCDKDTTFDITAPKITVSGTPSSMSYVEGDGPSDPESFDVSGVGLTGNLTVTAPDNFEVCKTSDGTYTSSVTLTPTSGTVSSTTIYVRLASGLSIGSYGASNVSVSGGSASTVNVSVSGVVSASCHTPTISADPSGATYNMNATATALSVTAAKGDEGDPSLTYQWYVSATNDNTAGSVIGGATSSTYTPPTTTAGTKYYYCVVYSGACSKASTCAAVTVNTPTLTASVSSCAFSTKKIGGTYTMTLTISGANLAKDATVAYAIGGDDDDMFSVTSPSSPIAQTSTGALSTTTVTVQYAPTTKADHSATLTFSSTGAEDVEVALSGTGQYVDTYMTAMHEADDDWEDYAEGVSMAGDGYTIPNPGDVDKAGTSCEGKHYHFVGWVENTYKASPSGHIIDASGTEDASNKTFWAVWEKESDSSTPVTYTKVTTISEGTYLMATMTNAQYVHQTTFAYAGKKLNNAVPPAYVWGDTIPVSISTGVISSKPATAKEITVTLGTGDDDGYFGMYDGEKYITMTAKGKFTYADAISYEWELNSNAYIHNKGEYDNSTAWMIILNNGNSGSPSAYFVPMKDKDEGNNGGSYYYHAFLFKKAGGIVYDDPKVECICSANPSAGTAAVDATGTFSASQIDVKATSISTGHADCSYTDYGFVWSTSVTTPTLVEATGAASTNCTKVPVGTSGEVTSFTGSLTGSFTANPIYLRSYVKNGKADGTYQYSSVVTINPRSVTFNLNGHGSSTPSAQLVNNGSKAADPSYSESVTGYIFGGWYKEAGCSNVWTFGTDVVSKDTVLYAKWTPITYSVRFNKNDANYLGDATGEMSNESFDYDESKDLTGIGFSLAGYNFAGWALTYNGDVEHLDGAEVENLSSTNSAVVDLYAIWSAKSYDVTLAATNATSGSSQTVSATYNAAMPLVTTADGTPDVAAPSRTGYTFTGWEYNSTTYYNYNAGTSTLTSAHVWDVAEEVELSPKWSTITYTITYNLNSGTNPGSVPTEYTIESSDVTLPTPTRSGYNFDGWYADSDLSTGGVHTTIATGSTGNKEYWAKWTAKTLTSISLAEDAVTIYDQQYVLVDVSYDPSDILTKGYTLVSSPTKVITTGSTNTQLKLSATKAGVVISEQVSETVSIQAKADDTKTASVTVTINPLPRVHFVDNVHNETFSDAVATISENALVATKTTPTHSDVANPSSASSCENTHLHLIGWIRSDYSKVENYMNGTGVAPTTDELKTAGTGYWFAPDADINVETYDGKTFYAVWAVEE